MVYRGRLAILMSNPDRKIKIIWDRKTLNKIWRKHKVAIEEVFECLKEKRTINRIGNKYRIIGRTKDRFITIFVYKVEADYETEVYKLATARSSTKQEQNYIEVRLKRMFMTKGKDEAVIAYPKKVTPILKNGEIVGVEIIEEVKPIRSQRKYKAASLQT